MPKLTTPRPPNIKVWIDVGQPDEKRIRKACGRAERVYVYAYGGHVTSNWWDQVGAKLERNDNLTVIRLPAISTRALAKLAQRNMQLNCTIQDGHIWMSDTNESVQMEPVTLKTPAAAL